MCGLGERGRSALGEQKLRDWLILPLGSGTYKDSPQITFLENIKTFLRMRVPNVGSEMAVKFLSLGNR